ncbi:DUF418 domain-containing protein [Candidatus Poribacteria bacterium]|nr:DUF418 domain-containing protein [Candidatus Poribacteria bacterium]
MFPPALVEAPSVSSPFGVVADSAAGPARPVSSADRVPSLDVVRGVALLGILLVNIYSFALPGASYTAPHIWKQGGALDHAAFSFVYLFALQKFFSLFSLLFGAGLFLQTRGQEARGKPATSLYVRRLGFLALFGVFHAVFIWHGDILLPYAVCGLIAFFMRKLSDRVLIWTAAAFFLIPFLCCCTPVGAAAKYGMQVQQAEWQRAAANDPNPRSFKNLLTSAEFPVDFDTAAPVLKDGYFENFGRFASYYSSPIATSIEANMYRDGGYLHIFCFRVLSWLFMLLAIAAGFGFTILAYMLAGIVLARRGVFQFPQDHSRLLKSFAVIGPLVGIPLNVIALALIYSSNDYLRVAAGAVQHLGAVCLTAGYLGILLLLCRGEEFLELASPLRAVGRMAFSNYILHSLVMTLIFYGYGLALYGRFGYAALLGFAVVMWAIQLAASPYRLSVFRFGPLEWLWRSFTYGRKQPMLR